MKYSETKLAFSEFLNMLAQHTEFDKDDECHLHANLQSASDESLNSGVEGYPSFYYFSNVGGKKYVLEENEDNGGSVVYEVPQVDEENEYPCEIILRDTVGMWDGDAYENLALYDISVKPTESDESDTDVKIWIEFYYSPTTLNAPLDRYARNNDVNTEDSSFEAYEAHEFDTYADAKAWIDKQESGRYYLSHGETDRPKYTITN